MSHNGDDPCPQPNAPADLPTIELRRRIGVVNEYYLGLAHFITDLAWAKQPDPVRACQILGNLIDQIDNLSRHLGYLREHADLLWTLSCEEDMKRGRNVV